MDTILKKYWGYDSFRPLQREAGAAVLEGRDSLLVLPTGGGKSLCFQAPALLMDGMAIVVCPLISLMKDQVDGLKELGISAECIHSDMTGEERRDVDQGIREGTLKLLYVSPERMVKPPFLEYLRNTKVSFLAIDEAHCISHWGHDFRPEYRELAIVREYFPDIAIHGYTATATERVRGDICKELKLQTPELMVGNFDRPNLVYRAESRTDAPTQVRAIVDRHPNEAGLVYCISRKAVEALTEELTTAGYSAQRYHAGMSGPDRKTAQEAFQREDVNIIVATVAFGMGIDKSNVRFVIHAGMPKSIEHYQQETGRAGRDGLEAECVLLHGRQDLMTWRRIMDQSDGDSTTIAMQKLDEISAYCSSVTCRHKRLVEYFGQGFDKANCGACDMCLGEGDLLDDAHKVATAILGGVQALGEVAGGQYTTLVLTGSREERVLSKGHDRLPCWGALSERNGREVRDWVEQLVSQGQLEKRGEYNVLYVTELGRKTLDGDGEVRLLKPPEKRKKQRASKSEGVSWEGVDRELFETMRALRKEIAQERKVPPYQVFGDVTLRDIARRQPTTASEFLQVHGVGQKKCDLFGDAFLACVRNYDGVAPTATPAPSPERPRKTVSPARAEAWICFERGESVDDVAEHIHRAVSTTVAYLVEYIKDEVLTDVSAWVNEETFTRIEEAAEKVGMDRAKTIKEFFQGELSYDDINVTLACLRNRSMASAGE